MLSKKDTDTIKGIALILLLVHHLFWKQNGLYDDIRLYGDYYLVNQIGIMSKVCVTMFVFLSGYGLMAKVLSQDGFVDLKSFYFRRFKKLMLNYWLIWLLFVPVSYFVFDYSFQRAYPENTVFHLLTDVCGIHSLVFPNTYCYNPTWWFYSCIITLYLLFPLLYRIMNESVALLVLSSLALSFLPLPSPVIRYYIVAFVFGMWMAKVKNTPPLSMLDFLCDVWRFIVAFHRKDVQ